MKTINEQLDLIDMAFVLGINPHVLRDKLRELEVINKPKVKDAYILTNIALYFDLGEIKIIEICKGHKLKDNVFNVEEVKKILNYNMLLSQLYDSMYPDDEEQDAFEVGTYEDYDDLPF